MFTTGMVFVDPEDPIEVHRNGTTVWMTLGSPGRTDLDISLSADLVVRLIAALVKALDDHADVLGIPEVQS